jgi:hypothetical protein
VRRHGDTKSWLPGIPGIQYDSMSRESWWGFEMLKNYSINTYRYILVGWTSIYQLFWGSLGTRVLSHPHVNSQFVLPPAMGSGRKWAMKQEKDRTYVWLLEGLISRNIQLFIMYIQYLLVCLPNADLKKTCLLVNSCLSTRVLLVYIRWYIYIYVFIIIYICIIMDIWGFPGMGYPKMDGL